MRNTVPMSYTGVPATSPARRSRSRNHLSRSSGIRTQRLYELESENAKLKRLLSEAHLDIHALKSVFGAKR